MLAQSQVSSKNKERDRNDDWANPQPTTVAIAIAQLKDSGDFLVRGEPERKNRANV